jgi:myo-inositol-1(or 4)-monophosphatase
MDEVAPRLRLIERILPRAGALALDLFRSPGLQVELKSAQDPVTRADVEVEGLLSSRLTRAFPEDGFWGEEGGRSGDFAEGDYVWVVDPIDGTANFARGIPHWCISVALVRGDQVELGCIHDPVNRETFVARRGGGARLNGKRIGASEVSELGRARVNVGFSYRRPPALHLRGIDLLLARGCEYSRLASGALGMAWTACGRFDAYWEPHINSWDVLAGVAIAKEAGCWVSDFFANEGFLQGNSILASARGIAAELHRLLEPLNEESRRYAKRNGRGRPR